MTDRTTDSPASSDAGTSTLEPALAVVPDGSGTPTAEPAAAPPPRSPRSRAGNAMGRTRAAALDGARRVLTEHGVRKATMGDIAVRGGLAKATLYNHFRTKDEVVAALVAEPVVQPVETALPELERRRDDAVATPVLGAGDLVVVAPALDLLVDPGVERGPVGHHLALRRRPRALLAAARAGGEVGVGLGRGHPLDPALDPDLTLDLVPREHDGRDLRGVELDALAAGVVGEEREARFVVAPQQHQPH